MSETRARLVREIESDPGLHFNGLVRRLDLAPGQVQYHLRRLRRQGEVIEESVRGRTHYFPSEYDERERRKIALLRRETARDIVLAVMGCGEARPSEVVEELSIARSTLEWHLDDLEGTGLVTKRRDERNRVTLVTPSPEETLHLLSTIRPTAPERMVDRFVRLVDRFLDGRGNQ